MPIDRDRAARAIEEFLRAMGQDPSNPDLLGTGARVASAWEEDILAGERVDAAALLRAESFPAPPGDTHGVVILRGAKSEQAVLGRQ